LPPLDGSPQATLGLCRLHHFSLCGLAGVQSPRLDAPDMPSSSSSSACGVGCFRGGSLLKLPLRLATLSVEQRRLSST